MDFSSKDRRGTAVILPLVLSTLMFCAALFAFKLDIDDYNLRRAPLVRGTGETGPFGIGAEGWTAISTFILAVFTMGLAGVTFRLFQVTKEGMAEQAALTRDSLKHAERSAQAAENAVANALESSRMQLRAYVTIQGADVVLVIGDRCSYYVVKIVLGNSGSTPAYEFCTSLSGGIFPHEELPFGSIRPRENPQLSILSNVGRFEINCNPVQISNEDLEEVRSGEKAIFIWGRVDYKDIFGVDRYFIYRDRISGHEGQLGGGRVGWAFKPHPLGYEAN